MFPTKKNLICNYPKIYLTYLRLLHIFATVNMPLSVILKKKSLTAGYSAGSPEASADVKTDKLAEVLGDLGHRDVGQLAISTKTQDLQLLEGKRQPKEVSRPRFVYASLTS